MRKPSYSRYSYCLLFCLQAVSQAIEYPKKANTDALNIATSWNVGTTTPGTSDVMLWNSAITIPNANTTVGTLPTMGANLSVAGLKVTDVAGASARNTAQRYTGFQSAAAANTLTLGASGVDMSAAFQTFMIQSRVVLDSNQTWNVTNANTSGSGAGLNQGEDLVIQGTAANTPFNFNGKTLTTTGAGQILLHSGLTVGSTPLSGPAANGTLIVGNDGFIIQGGTNQVTTIQDTLNVQVNGRFRLQNNSGAGGVSLVSAAPITVNSGGTFELRCNNGATSFTQSGPITLKAGATMSHLIENAGASAYTTSGPITVEGNATWRVIGTPATAIPANGAAVSGSLSGSGNINYLNTATGKSAAPVQDLGQVRLSGDNSAYTGTFSINETGATGNRSLRLSSATAGSAAATWNIGTNNKLEIDGVSVQLGSLTGPGTVTNSSTAALATVNLSRGKFPGVISDGVSQATAVTKVGPDKATLSGANTYTGVTTVSEGTLAITSDWFTSDPVVAGTFTVADGATLSTGLNPLGAGTAMTGNVTVGSSSAGGTLQFDYDTATNPVSALLAAGTVRFNGSSIVKVTGRNLTAGTFPLLQYASYDAAGTAVPALTLALPPRTNGVLTDTGFNIINLTINSTQQVKWNGNVSNDWDIDPTGGGVVGTPNWLTTVTNASTRYIQGTPGADVVNFDDTASAGTEKIVNLTAALAPAGITFNNSAKNYTFTGSGKLTGTTGIEKNGTGTLTLANTTANDYSGATTISAGTLRLGDGITAGGGSITGNITNEGSLVLNRPDNFDIAATVSGAGSLTQSGAGTAGITGAVTITGPITLSAGKLKLAGGGTLPGDISGTGQLEAAGGALAITGSNANSTGLVTVSAGTLSLNKTAGVNAVGGNIDITGTGEVAILGSEQIPNTATIRALGTSADSLRGSTGTETFANAVVDGVAATQLILRSNANVTGTATINQGVLSIASGNSATVNAITMTSPTAILRLPANSGSSTLNVGPGGISASAGTIEVKQNSNPQDGILNLGGDLTTTGNLAITNGDTTAANLNVINVQGNRAFNIGAGTTTTVAADIAGTAADSLSKTGTGTLRLLPSCALNITSTAGTIVSAGTLSLRGGSIAGNLQVGAAGTLAGNGTISGPTVVAGTLAPTDTADSITTLTSTAALTFQPGSVWAVDIGSWTGLAPGTDWDLLSAGTLGFTATSSNKMTVRISGTPTGFTEVAKTLAIGTSTSAIAGFQANAIQVDASSFVGSGTWEVRQTGNTIELVYTPSSGSAYDSWASVAGLTEANKDPDADPDNDGQNNRLEFALSGSPLSGSANTQVVSKIASVGGQLTLTLTLPVRNGVSFGGSPSKNGSADGITYTVEATDDIAGWDATVTEVTGADATAIQSSLPNLPSGWTYKTFQAPGPFTTEKKGFMRVVVNPAA